MSKSVEFIFPKDSRYVLRKGLGPLQSYDLGRWDVETTSILRKKAGGIWIWVLLTFFVGA